jgi:hypothetical protein
VTGMISGRVHEAEFQVSRSARVSGVGVTTHSSPLRLYVSDSRSTDSQNTDSEDNGSSELRRITVRDSAGLPTLHRRVARGSSYGDRQQWASFCVGGSSTSGRWSKIHLAPQVKMTALDLRSAVRPGHYLPDSLCLECGGHALSVAGRCGGPGRDPVGVVTPLVEPC